MTAARIVLLLVAGVAAGIVGSAGGTASLIAYPALLAAGMAPLPADITISVAFVAAWPGSALGSRPELRGQGPWLRRWAALAVAGSAAGAALLLVTPAATFARVVPFLLAFAALALLLQPQISAWLARHRGSGSRFLLPGGLTLSNEVSRVVLGCSAVAAAGWSALALSGSFWKPIGRSCASRFAGGWTADGMACPLQA